MFPNSENPYWERPGDFENEDDVPANATISDFFWCDDFPHLCLLSIQPSSRFAIIRYICQETQTIHVQWFEHGKGIVLQELSHDQHIFLIDLCGIVGYSDVAGKVQVRWNVDVDIPLDVDTFVCKYVESLPLSRLKLIKAQLHARQGHMLLLRPRHRLTQPR